ncbi:spore-associated protein A [Streptomyces sp. NBC_01497]|uniref:spore-associated protein A n=1 Tax=Streptomyces sp. NBC_01497 TaxID=2903885 RepID=UPI002E33659E|nr:spore-associated protein A [Streptomyces sp. NBC_01497]
MKYSVIAAAVATAGALLACSATSAVAAPDRPVGNRHATVDLGRPAVAAAMPAQAAAPATYNSACGSGYSVIDTLPITTLGHVYLTYNASTGYNCVVTVRNTSGSAVPMNAWISRSDATTDTIDKGNFQTYAGPVYVHAAGTCIDWGGLINGYSAFREHVHCG